MTSPRRVLFVENRGRGEQKKKKSRRSGEMTKCGGRLLALWIGRGRVTKNVVLV